MKIEEAIKIAVNCMKICGVAEEENHRQSSGFFAAIDVIKEQLKDIHRKNVYMRALAIALEYDDDQITKHIEQAELELSIK